MPEYDKSANATSPTTELLSSNDAESELEANMRLLFDKSISNVRAYSVKFQKDFIKPAYGRTKVFYESYPVLSLYIAIYLLLSSVPVLLFLGTSVFLISASITVALMLATVFAACVISCFAILLFATLFWISLVSVVASVIVLTVYHLMRLVVLIREQSTWQAGVRQWVSELCQSMLSRLPGRKVEDQPAEDPQVKLEERDADLSQQ